MIEDDNAGIMIDNNEEAYDDMIQDDNGGDITVKMKQEGDNIYNSDPEDIEGFKAWNKSIIHDYVEDGTTLFVSFDIETGGDDCGIFVLV